MSQFITNCPSCGQPLECQTEWAGQAIQCPACSKEMIVPGAAAPPPAAARPSAVKGKGSAFAGAGKGKGKKSPDAKKIVTILLVVVVCGVGAFFGFKALMSMQAKMNAADERERNLSGGGQGEAGHAATLNAVLDATDPNRFSRLPVPERSGPDPDEVAARMRSFGGTAVAIPTNDLPLLPAPYSLEVAAVKIPEGRVNGKLAGTNFVPDAVRLDPGTTSRPLRFRMGNPAAPDLELIVFIKAKAGESLAGKTWTVAKEDKSREISSISKLWKPNPKYAPKRKDFFTGYALKLELAAGGEGFVKGKIYVALPDAEESVLAGVFYAEAPETPVVAAPAPAPAGALPTRQPLTREGSFPPPPNRAGKPR